jgi:ATP-dependent RNA helicase DHX37/DHR1
VRSTVTLNSKKPPPFNASGSLGVVEIAPTASPTASTSTGPPVSAATIPAAIGSGLKEGVVVTVVKRAKKEKGRMRALAGKASKGKGKQVESEEEEESEFDSSDSAMDDDEEDGGDSDAESWYGIDEDKGNAAVVDDGAAPQGESDDDDGEDASSDDDNEDASSAPTRPPREKGAFQAWADAQLLSAAGLTSSLPIESPTSSSAPYTPLLATGTGFRAAADPTGITGPLGAVIPSSQLPTLPPQRTTHIPIERTEEMQKQRAELPIVKEEDRIMEAIRGNAVVVICGETGSGKTTQVGQFLWEAGWGDPSSGESNFAFAGHHKAADFLSLLLFLPPSQTTPAWSP